jgi:hypothetical protein
MHDPLLSRAVLAIEESNAIRERSRVLRVEQGRRRDQLRRAILESASMRTEAKACRDDRE